VLLKVMRLMRIYSGKPSIPGRQAGMSRDLSKGARKRSRRSARKGKGRETKEYKSKANRIVNHPYS